MNVTIEDLVNAFRAEATEISQKEEKARCELLGRISGEMGSASKNLEPTQLQLIELGKHAPELMQWKVSPITMHSDRSYGWAELEVSFRAHASRSKFEAPYEIVKKFSFSRFGQQVASVRGGLLCKVPSDHREAIICLSKLVGQVLATGTCSM